ncbi:MAG: type 4a pilus biogenesis protein PilO [Gammaproteobacteria bacterium]
MNLSELNELDFSNVGSWPASAKAVVVAVLCAAVILGVYWFDTRHQYETLQGLESKEASLKQTVQIKAAKASNLAAYKRQLDEMRQSFGEMKRQLPNKTEVAGLLVDISQTGLAAGLQFQLFQPGPEVKKDFYAELPIQIRVTGTFHQFGNFVSGVAALPRIVTLHNIHISSEAKEKNKLVMTAVAKTYRYLTEEEEAGK